MFEALSVGKERLGEESRDEMSARRRTFLGCSELAAVCGLSPWATPLHVYLSKKGRLADCDSAPMQWGRRLEDVVAAAYQEETGQDVFMPPSKTIVHPRLSFLGASLDRVVAVQPGKILECKTSSQPQEWGTPGTDEIPEYYAIQVQGQMACSGLDTADVAVLINGSDFRVFQVQADREAQRLLLEMATDFWDQVQNNIEPSPTWQHPATAELLRKLWSVDAAARVELPEELTPCVREYQALGVKLRQLTKERESIKSRLLWHMEQAGVGRLPNGLELIRRVVHRQGYSCPPTTYVSFRVKEKGGNDGED